MKITLDQATLGKAVITHLRSVGVQADILDVNFRYTRVPYTVFAEVELADGPASKPTKTPVVVELPSFTHDEPPSFPPSLVDPDNLPAEDVPDERPPPDMPAAPLFGGS